jgi:hypothetical protein
MADVDLGRHPGRRIQNRQVFRHAHVGTRNDPLGSRSRVRRGFSDVPQVWAQARKSFPRGLNRCARASSPCSSCAESI